MTEKIILADSSHKSELTALWRDTFGDSEDFICDFIDGYMFPEYNAPAMLVNGEVTAAFYLIDFPLYSNSVESGIAAYLFAAATKSEYRGRGYMSALVKHAAELYKNRDYSAIFLFPQEESLFNYYSRFGFVPHYRKAVVKGAGTGIFDGEYTLSEADISDVKFFDELYTAYLETAVKGNIVPVKDRLFYYKCTKTYGGNAAVFSRNDSTLCFLFYRKVNNNIYIDDIIIPENNISEKNEIISALVNYANEIIIPPMFAENAAISPIAMLLPLRDKASKIAGQSGDYINMFMNY